MQSKIEDDENENENEQVEQPDELTPEEEKALDEYWDNVDNATR
jgi:hypothetical protein